MFATEPVATGTAGVCLPHWFVAAVTIPVSEHNSNGKQSHERASALGRVCGSIRYCMATYADTRIVRSSVRGFCLDSHDCRRRTWRVLLWIRGLAGRMSVKRMRCRNSSIREEEPVLTIQRYEQRFRYNQCSTCSALFRRSGVEISCVGRARFIIRNHPKAAPSMRIVARSAFDNFACGASLSQIDLWLVTHPFRRMMRQLTHCSLLIITLPWRRALR